MTHSKITAKLNDKGELVFLAYKELAPTPEELLKVGFHNNCEINSKGRKVLDTSAVKALNEAWQQSAVEYRAFDKRNEELINNEIGLRCLDLWADVDVTEFVEIRGELFTQDIGENGMLYSVFYKHQEPLSGVSEGKEESRIEKKGNKPAISYWSVFDSSKTETYPAEYGKYLISRKDGKIHWETWNGSGWAYNHNAIAYWAFIMPPSS